MIVRKLLGARATKTLERQCALSVVGQCLYYYHSRPFIHCIAPEQKFEPADIEQLAKHITQFSLAGIRRAVGKP